MPNRKPDGAEPPGNHALSNAVLRPDRSLSNVVTASDPLTFLSAGSSAKTPDCPAGRIEEAPPRVVETESANASELSSIVQPLKSIGWTPKLVNSNQSALYASLEPVGSTSVTVTVGAMWAKPGEPVSPSASVYEPSSPPASLNVSIAPVMPAELSNDTLFSEAPNETPVTKFWPAS